MVVNYLPSSDSLSRYTLRFVRIIVLIVRFFSTVAVLLSFMAVVTKWKIVEINTGRGETRALIIGGEGRGGGGEYSNPIIVYNFVM